MTTDARPLRLRLLRWVRRVRCSPTRSCSNFVMRFMMRRRSTSRRVSPGPRVPMPPPCCDKPAFAPRRSRGRRYRNIASSTCALPSSVCAFWAKMSRMTAVRSSAVRPNAFSRLYCCAGDNSLSNTTVSASRARHTSFSSSTFPLPMYHVESGESRRCVSRAASSAPAVSMSNDNSSNPSSVSSSVCPPRVTPTSTMRSRNARSIRVAPRAS